MRYLFIICATLAFSLTANAQKKKTKAKAAPKVVVKAPAKPDYSEYTNNPICKVMIVDSTVVNINDIATTLSLPQHMGHYFTENGKLIYENDFGDTRLMSLKDNNGQWNIYRETLLNGKWSEPEQVTINGDLTDKAYPFPGSDGQTLYFAGKSADDNEGTTYSLYTTTWDSESSSYKVPQKLPYPFVSKDANDLMFLEDDIDSLAWLITTRRQPEGMACIYTLSLHQPWEYYDAEATPGATLRSYALIEHINDTWTSDTERNEILNRAKSIGKYTQSLGGIRFVINDNKVYNSLADFKTSEGRMLYAEWNSKKQQLETINHQLDEYRLLYSRSMPYDRRKLTSTITELESQQVEVTQQVASLAKQIRQQEQ